MQNNVVALLGVTGLALLAAVPSSFAAPLPSHPNRAQHAPRLGEVKRDWRPGLQSALQSLASADQAMRSSPTPNIAGVIGYLRTAHGQLQAAPAIFHGHRETAIQEIQKAVNQLKQASPNPKALSLTENAAVNTQWCLSMHP